MFRIGGSFCFMLMSKKYSSVLHLAFNWLCHRWWRAHARGALFLS
jgi:hypothetical protein